jgi:imidazolonepropionase-like amidohydrolase
MDRFRMLPGGAAAVLVWVLAAGAGGHAQEATHAFVNARILPIGGPAVERGTLVVRGTTILAIGPEGTAVPAGAERHDLSGKVIMPGLVDTHSHVGSPAGADASGPIQPDVRVLDSIDARSTSFTRALAGGITTVNVMPGSGHLLSGQTLYLKLRGGTTIDQLTIVLPDGRIAGGLKFANGTNPLRPGSAGPFPGTRARSASLVREQFVKAVEYREKVRKAGGDGDKLPARDLGMEALVEVLEGKRTVHFHTHRHDDIVTVLRLAKEFGFTPVLQHVSEGWKVADEIARAGAPCSIIMIDSPGGKLEAVDLSYTTGAVLEKAGVLTAFHTDDYITDSRLLLRSAALGVRAGMSREKALYAVTLAGARMLQLDTRIGSLERGKDADFVILSGDPLSVYTRVEQTWVEGRKVFDLENPADRLIAVGGYGATRGEVLHADHHDDRGGLE